MFPILDNIPGIHATIIGILAAFFSVFFMFAYQKVTETKKMLDRSLKVAESFSKSDFFYFSDCTLIDNNGDLNWDEDCRTLIRDSILLFSSLRSRRNLPSLHPDSQTVQIDPIQVGRLVNEFLCLFSLFFSTYPFYKTPLTSASKLFKGSIDNEFNYSRYYEIERRISDLMHDWNNNQESLIQLFKTYDEIQENNHQMDYAEHLAFYKAESEKIVGMDKKIWESVFQEAESLSDIFLPKKRLPELYNFFNKVKKYQEEVMPVISESLSEFESYNNELKVKEITKFALKTLCYILVFGVIFPLILLELLTKVENANNYFIISYIEYFILLISFAPYFLICIYFIRKIETTIFK